MQHLFKHTAKYKIHENEVHEPRFTMGGIGGGGGGGQSRWGFWNPRPCFPITEDKVIITGTM